MNLPALIASIPVADLGGKYAQHVALVIAARFLDENGDFNARQYDVRMATGLSKSTIVRAFAELRKCGALVYGETGLLRFGERIDRLDPEGQSLEQVNAMTHDWVWKQSDIPTGYRPNYLRLVPITP